MKSRAVSSLIAITFVLLGSSSGAQIEPQFAKANQEYANGHFKEAIDAYQTLVRNGVWSANLFYDLGNAYFHASDYGRAILNYERALALDRHHPEAQANLRIVRDEARALEMTPGNGERVVQFAGTNQYAIVAAVTFWAGIFLVVWWVISRRRAGGLIACSILSLSICALAVLSIFWIENGSHGRMLAVVTDNKVEARLATADSARSVLALPAGSEIKILSKRGGWIYAALPNNLRGWIPLNSAEQVRL